MTSWNFIQNYLKNHPDSQIEEFPWGIDLHVHFREPGFVKKETMFSGMTAAKFGGINTVIDMPNTFPTPDTLPILKEKLELANQFPGILIAAGLTNRAVEMGDLRRMAKLSPIFKVFLANSTGNLMIEHSKLLLGLKQLDNSKSLIIFHCEDPKLITERTEISNELECRPVEAEIISTKSVIELSKDYPNQQFHITHISSYDAAKELVKQSKVTWDVLPKHLDFTYKLVDKLGNFAKMNPPLRDKRDVEGLNRLFQDGKVPFITSDHAPHTIEEKSSPVAGAPGVQELYPFLIDRMLNGDITKELLVKLIFENPKRLLSTLGIKLSNKTFKVDLNGSESFTKGNIKSKCGWSLWENKTFQGKLLIA